MIDLAGLGRELNDAAVLGAYVFVALSVLAVLAAIADRLGEP